jgi:hypothetical protein
LCCIAAYRNRSAGEAWRACLVKLRPSKEHSFICVSADFAVPKVN